MRECVRERFRGRANSRLSMREPVFGEDSHVVKLDRHFPPSHAIFAQNVFLKFVLEVKLESSEDREFSKLVSRLYICVGLETEFTSNVT